jgi:hypothetical protein
MGRPDWPLLLVRADLDVDAYAACMSGGLIDARLLATETSTQSSTRRGRFAHAA